jgi:hypothetical protein
MRDLPEDSSLPAAGPVSPAPKCAACGCVLVAAPGEAPSGFAPCPCGEQATAATRAAIGKGVEWLFQKLGANVKR